MKDIDYFTDNIYRLKEKLEMHGFQCFYSAVKGLHYQDEDHLTVIHKLPKNHYVKAEIIYQRFEGEDYADRILAVQIDVFQRNGMSGEQINIRYSYGDDKRTINVYSLGLRQKQRSRKLESIFLENCIFGNGESFIEMLLLTIIKNDITALSIEFLADFLYSKCWESDWLYKKADGSIVYSEKIKENEIKRITKFSKKS
jgi:hypothetical protein